MLFQTLDYAVFFFITTSLILIIKNDRIQKCLLLLASLYFYSVGSLVHLPLFLAVICFTYVMAMILQKHHKKWLLALTIVLSFVPLFIYKYLPFLYGELYSGCINESSWIVRLSLPVGISFYTFQSVGYVIDVWRGKQKAEKDLLVYAVFVSFFPQLIAGPIERSSNLLGQIKQTQRFEYSNVARGFKLMAMGLFLKVFIADRLSIVVDRAYNNVGSTSGLVLLMSTLLFGLQIYCDFNGYSTIARGSAKVLGIDLIENFRRPYFSLSCSEFWRRWHISLSTWFKDYLYIPLGGNRCGPLRNSFNLFFTFLVSGIWHGANWTFAIWGGVNGLYQIIEKRIFKTVKREEIKGTWQKLLRWVLTYTLINFSWIFFRANNLADAFLVIKKIVTSIPLEIMGLLNRTLSVSSVISLSGSYIWNLGMCIIGVCSLFVLSWYQEYRGDIIDFVSSRPRCVRILIYFLILFITLCFGQFGSNSQFIYFRF